jgi:hypothetical protein
MTPRARAGLVRTLGVLATGALALAVFIVLTGGTTYKAPGLRLGLQGWQRPLLAGLALLALRAWVEARGTPGAGWRRALDPVRLATLGLGAATLASTGYWATYFSPYCGGSDSYGYVSASQALLAGALVQPQEIAGWLPVANALDVATPAGWVPAADRSGSVPLYPLGLPVLMALATMVAGPIGPYLVAPACGFVCLVLTYRLARDAFGHFGAWLAVTVVAWHPLVITYAKQPMSDVPAAMWLLLAAWAVLPARHAPLAAGLAAGASFLTRPGGLGACLAVGVFAIWTAPSRTRSAIRFAAGLAPFVLLQALLQWHFFGHPFRTGYGRLDTLYGGVTIWGNLATYAEAIWRTGSPSWLAAVAAAWLLASRTLVTLATVVFAVSAVPYLLYLPFDHWETLRFLMPGLVLMTVVAAGGATTAFQRLSRRPVWLALLVGAFALWTVTWSHRFLRSTGSQDLEALERRYPAVAAHVDRYTPPDAVVLAAQHSGSLRHYARRQTLRWDLLRPEDLPVVLDALLARQRRVFIVLEGEEAPRFLGDFAVPLQGLGLAPVGSVLGVQIWELTPRATLSRSRQPTSPWPL